MRYERFSSIAVNALGVPGVSVNQNVEVSVTRRFQRTNFNGRAIGTCVTKF